MTGRYVGSTFVEDQREFVEHLQIGKQIGKLLDMPKSPQAQKHIFWVWNMKKLKKCICLTRCATKQCWYKFFTFFQNIIVFFFVLAKTNLGSRRKITYLDHGPYGPQGPWAQPLFDCVAVPSGGFVSAKTASQQI